MKNQNPNPSGALMLARSKGVGQKVDEILPRYRSTTGDYGLIWLRILKYYPNNVSVSYTKNSGITIHFYSYKDIMYVPSHETVRRRAQERFHYEKAKIWEDIDAEFPLEQFSKEFRKAEFYKRAAKNKYLPSERVLEKRNRLERAYRKEFSQQIINNYIAIETEEGLK